MTKRLFFIVAIASIFILPQQIQAQDSTAIQTCVRIGYIDCDSIIKLLPDYQTGIQNVGKLQSQYEQEYASMQNAYNEKVKSYLENNGTLKRPIKLARQAEITEDEQRMAVYKENYTNDIRSKKKGLYDTSHALVNNAVKQVAKAYKINIVFDNKTPVYVDETCVNLTPDVKKLLGL